MATTRKFVDGEGIVWQVRETSCPPSVRRDRSRCLIFESDYNARRVRNYPERWAELTDAQLAALSWQT